LTGGTYAPNALSPDIGISELSNFTENIGFALKPLVLMRRTNLKRASSGSLRDPAFNSTVSNPNVLHSWNRIHHVMQYTHEKFMHDGLTKTIKVKYLYILLEKGRPLAQKMLCPITGAHIYLMLVC
jgi:hypothetical protein